MTKIKYIGSYLKVLVENVPFVRHMPVEVSDEFAAKLLEAKIADSKIFERVSPAFVPPPSDHDE